MRLHARPWSWIRMLAAVSLAVAVARGCHDGGAGRDPGRPDGGGSGGSSANEGGDAGSSGGKAGGGGGAAGSGGAASGGTGSGEPDAGSSGGTGLPPDADLPDAAGEAPSDLGAADTGADGTGPGPAFAAVLKIFKGRCTGCHAAGAIAPGMPSLHLTSDVAYRSLVGVPAEQTCGGTLVVPSSSEQSYLMRKLIEATPCQGVQMPMAFEAPFMPLSEADLAAIRSWIDQGAPP